MKMDLPEDRGNSTLSLLGSEGKSIPPDDDGSSECTDSLLAALASVSLESRNEEEMKIAAAKPSWEDWLLNKERQSRQSGRKMLAKKRKNNEDEKDKRSKLEAQLHWKKWVILKDQQLSAQMKAKKLEEEIQRISLEKKDQTKKEDAEIKYQSWMQKKMDFQKRRLEEEKAEKRAVEIKKRSSKERADLAYKRWLGGQTAKNRKSSILPSGHNQTQPSSVINAACWRELVSPHHIDTGCCCQCSHLPGNFQTPLQLPLDDMDSDFNISNHDLS